jgi:hypothetical protein
VEVSKWFSLLKWLTPSISILRVSLQLNNFYSKNNLCAVLELQWTVIAMNAVRTRALPLLGTVWERGFQDAETAADSSPKESFANSFLT